MRILIVGAGTIGLTYGWLLSSVHEVTFLVRPERLAFYQQPFTLTVRDQREGRADGVHSLVASCVTELDAARYDAVLVTVDRLHLDAVLPSLAPAAGRCPLVFMLNHWDLVGALAPRFTRDDCVLAFGSQVGGGRLGHEVDVTAFATGTVVERTGGVAGAAADRVAAAFSSAGLTVRRQRRMGDWLTIHSMQQSLTAAPLVQAGSYDAFVSSRAAVAELVRAFREGLATCRAVGVQTSAWPAPLFRLPAPLVARALRGMFSQPEIRTMVTLHARHGLDEWIAGFRDLHAAARRAGVRTPTLDAYARILDARTPTLV